MGPPVLTVMNPFSRRTAGVLKFGGIAVRGCVSVLGASIRVQVPPWLGDQLMVLIWESRLAQA